MDSAAQTEEARIQQETQSRLWRTLELLPQAELAEICDIVPDADHLNASTLPIFSLFPTVKRHLIFNIANLLRVKLYDHDSVQFMSDGPEVCHTDRDRPLC
jgi:hypothetical protein